MIPRGLYVAMAVSAAAIIVILVAMPWFMVGYHVEELRGIPFEPRVIPFDDHVGVKVHLDESERYTLVEIGTVRVAFLHAWNDGESLFELRTAPGTDGSPRPGSQSLTEISGVPGFTYRYEMGMGDGQVHGLAFRIRDGNLEVGRQQLPLAGDPYLVVVRHGRPRVIEKLETTGG